MLGVTQTNDTQTFQPICSKNEHKRACPVVFPPHCPENSHVIRTAIWTVVQQTQDLQSSIIMITKTMTV